MALGAGNPEILRLVMIQAMAPTLIGVAVGLAIAFAATRLMESLLYGVKANDPLSFFGVATILILVAIVAVLIPVRRAMSVHPMTALRMA
jgi:putative ABC transport system permease protein